MHRYSNRSICIFASVTWFDWTWGNETCVECFLIATRVSIEFQLCFSLSLSAPLSRTKENTQFLFLFHHIVWHKLFTRWDANLLPEIQSTDKEPRSKRKAVKRCSTYMNWMLEKINVSNTKWFYIVNCCVSFILTRPWTFRYQNLFSCSISY